MGNMRLRRRLTSTLSKYTQGLAWTLVGLALTWTLAFVTTVQPAQAHGGGKPQLVNAQAGPYRVSAWTQPEPIRVGTLHLSVAVSESPGPGSSGEETGDLVLDAAVRVRMNPMSQPGPGLVTSATREDAVNKLLYEADVELPAEGQWQVVISVEGAAGTGSASFNIEVLPSLASNTLPALGTFRTLRWPVWAGLALVLLTVGWSIQTFRGQALKGE
jgi:hypothetical protein